jgi:hypothetical protein
VAADFPRICRKRHLRDQFTADARANPRELLARKGHDSSRAVLIYLHSSAERQRVLANEVGRNAKAALSKPDVLARGRHATEECL